MSENDPPLTPDPAPVKVQNEEPIPVEVMQDEPLRVRTEQDKVAATRVSSSDRALAEAKVEADITRAGAIVSAAALRTEDQRRISGIWEGTQRMIALAVVFDALIVVSVLVLAPVFILVTGGTPDDATKTAAVGGLLFLTAVSNLVIGFYFGRTNHTRVGGAATEYDQLGGR